MISPVALRANYSDLYGSSMLPVLEEIFKGELEMHPSRREILGKVVAHDRDIYQSSELHDLDLFNQVSEGAEYSFKRPKQGASKTMTVLKYGLGFSISEEMVSDGKLPLIADMTKMLAKSARETQEVAFMNLFNNGFSSETTADAVSVFNSAHTLPSGLTFRNVLSTDADLSAASLEQALIDFESVFVGDSGIIYRMQPKYLVVPVANKRLAKELVGSDLKPDTADNNINSLKDDGLIVVSSPHLSDSDSWFLSAGPDASGVRIIQREPIMTKAAGPDVGFTTDAILYKSRYREVLGVVHPYGLFGSDGV